jgi:NAD(P)-dependent dehydrogenase (short-subunit alcohol dehydrogenase family)
MSERNSVLVTGAAGGIGEACVRQLRAQGMLVTAFDRSQDALSSKFGGDPDIACWSGDVQSADDCKAAVDLAAAQARFSGVIHCAAIHSSATWGELHLEELQRVLGVNVGGAFLVAQAAATHMIAHGGGAIVLMSSSNVIAGGVGGQAGMGGPAYVASKSAIIGLVRSLARSLGPHRINVNGVMPGVTQTPMIENYTPEHLAKQTAMIPLGRIAQPADIAEVSCFLVSQGARYMTGETVIVNGGAQFG